MGFRIAATSSGPGVTRACVNYRVEPKTTKHAHAGAHTARVQRLVAKTVYVERETALVVGSDNVLLGFGTACTDITWQSAPEWGAFPVVRLSIR